MIIDSKPFFQYGKYKVKKKEKDDITRCKNNSEKKFGMMTSFGMVNKSDKSEIENFIAMHKKRWDGGPFNDLHNFEYFIKEMINSDLVFLFKVQLNDSTNLAYHFLYKGSSQTLVSSIPTYNVNYKELSPGKVLLYEIIEYFEDKNILCFDFGRGAESYKYWFSDEVDLLFNVSNNIETDYEKFKKSLRILIKKTIIRLKNLFIKKDDKR